MEDRVNQILGAAQRRFARYGYEKTTVEEVAGDVGLVKSALYKYFENKEALLEGVMERDSQIQLELMRAEAKHHQDPAERLLAMMLARLEYERKSHADFQFRRSVLVEFKPLMRQKMIPHIQKTSQIIIDTIREGQATGRFFATPDAETIAELFLQALLGLFSEVLRTPQPLSTEEEDDGAALLEKLLSRMELLTRLLVTGMTVTPVSINLRRLHD